MPSQINFSKAKINRLRKQAAKAAEPPDSCPNGWRKSTVDPMDVLAVFKSLRIKEGYTLRAYQFREGGNGNGFVWAVPVDAEFPDPKECSRIHDGFLDPPKPPMALDDVMESIDGDGSPWSFMCASIFSREIAEFGAMWHGCDWDTHEILESEPWLEKGAKESISPESEWEWLQPKPNDWRPQVVQDGDDTTVAFLTFSGLGQETIYLHRDVFAARGYKLEANSQIIAKGCGGYVF